MQDPDQDAIGFAARPAANIAWALFFLGFGILFITILWLAPDRSDPRYFVVLIVTPLIALFAVYFGRSVGRWRETILTFDDRGFLDWRISDTRIPWSAVESFQRRAAYPGFRFGSYFLVRLEPTYQKNFSVKPLYRIAYWLNTGLTGGYFVMPLGTSARVDDIERALDRYCPRWRQSISPLQRDCA